MNCYKFESGFNIKLFLIIASVLLLVTYGIFNARNLITGPTVEIFSPAENTETTENNIEIKGQAKNTAFLSLNEKPIFVDKEGVFSEKLLLSPGSNIIEIKAKDRFKKELTKTIKIYYKQSTTTPPILE
ncbi:MAG: hypothetical protein WC657_00070 [Candidatus Paceibacterota bacterium]|jgi:hypothetical protein